MGKCIKYLFNEFHLNGFQLTAFNSKTNGTHYEKVYYYKVINEDEFGRPSIFQFLAPKNIAIEQLRDKIESRKRSPGLYQFNLYYRDNNNDLIELKHDEDLDCALKRHPSFLQADTFLCVIVKNIHDY
ncbi:hypothetical protein BDC45DRAFT_538502 [Circinella umbellata]|nr:hypothetical protein BDC45DRAFT_538502 [Circinella umbellata]